MRLMKQMPDDADTAAKVVAFWSMRMIGMELDEPRRKVIERLVAGDDDVDAVLDVGEGELAQRVQRAVVGLAMSPEFQVR